MADEKSQEAGRVGVGQVKAWLESTTWISLPFNAYENDAQCKVATHNNPKKFDLRGFFLGNSEQRRNVSVECKNYSSPGGQGIEFDEFLAIAYSATHKKTQDLNTPWREDFIWVTKHPFSQTNWRDLTSKNHMIEVLNREKFKAYLGADEIDDDLAAQVAARIWVLVLNDKQLDITLTAQELSTIMPGLERSGSQLWKH